MSSDGSSGNKPMLKATVTKGPAADAIQSEFASEDVGSPTEPCPKAKEAGINWVEFVPVVGPLMDASNDMKKGRWGWALFNGAMAISDVFLLKGLAVGAGKLAFKLLAKEAVKDAEKLAVKEGAALAEKEIAKEAEETIVKKVRKIKLREKYLGRTPGKASKTGREVIERMRGEGKIRDGVDGLEFLAKDNKWYDIKRADMAHKTDAVKWWNEVGREYGPKSPEVRKWMLDSKNYELELDSINRSLGAKLPDRYLPPLK